MGYNILLELDFDEFLEQVNTCIEKDADEWLMKRWIANYEKEMSFDEFKNKLGIKNNFNLKINKKTTKEILEDVNDIIKISSESEVI